MRRAVANAKSHNQRVAENYAVLGLSVFPCYLNKFPLVKWREESTTDLETIEKWYRLYQNAPPAIDHSKSGLIGIDADRHGTDDGVAALCKLVDVFKLDAPVVHTPGNGLHAYFKQPDPPLGNRRGSLPDGVDVRGVGGYTIAPEAMLSNGRRYRPDFRTPTLLKALQSISIPALPEVLEKLITNAREIGAANVAEQRLPTSRSTPSAREAAYAAATLKESARELAEAKRGGRNNKLNKTAFRLATMSARGWVTQDVIRAELVAACRSNGLLGERAVAVHATITSAFKAGLKHPHRDLQDQSNPINTIPRSPSQSSGLETICAADVTPENIAFIWQGRLARGKHTCIAGEGGLGKSALICAMVAAVTTGGDWPCSEGKAPIGNVVFLSAEDGLKDVLVPRLMAAGADLNRVHFVQATITDDGKGKRKFDLRADLEKLTAKINEIGDVVLVPIDPISSYLGSVDSHNNTKLRAVLDPISDAAEAANAAFVSVTHLTKGSGAKGIRAINRVMGGVGFTTAPRAAFAVVQDPNDPGRRLLLHLKNNIGPEPQGLAFRLQQRAIGADERTGEFDHRVRCYLGG